MRLTREGRGYLAVSLGVGLAAINTGNNLLYLLLGWLLSIILASGFMSNAMLRAISLRRRVPSRVHAGKPCSIAIEVTNKKRGLVSFSLLIEDFIEGRPLDRRCSLQRVNPHTTVTTQYLHCFPNRGNQTFDGFRLITRFPFGLFEKSLFINDPQIVTVLPQVTSVRRPQMSSQLYGDTQANRLGRNGEFFGLRDYRNGDDKRSIHWVSSARRNRLLVKEFQEESQRQVTVVLDNALAPNATWEDQQGLEAAIVRAASYASEFTRRNFSVALVTRGNHVPFATGQAQLFRVLRTLALLPTAPLSEPFSANPKPRGAHVLCAPTVSDVSELKAA